MIQLLEGFRIQFLGQFFEYADELDDLGRGAQDLGDAREVVQAPVDGEFFEEVVKVLTTVCLSGLAGSR